jgi:hypothetical protein
MASTINGTSTGNGGLISTGDDSGILNIQTNETTAITVDASQNVGIGTSSVLVSGSVLNVQGLSNGATFKVTAAASNWSAFFWNSNSGSVNFTQFLSGSGGSAVGSITYNGTLTVYGTTSDQRLKQNIVDAPSAFNFVNSLKIRSFDWKESNRHQQFGVIAQELVQISPESVYVPQEEKDNWQVDTSSLVPALVKALQETKVLIDTQAATINALTARIVALETA